VERNHFISSLFAFGVQVDSVNKDGILMEVVQVLSDVDLNISKAHIISDGEWFMDGKNRDWPVVAPQLD
jgi:(p)ppGpp synthase/HD superfamily hydrolase